MTEEEKQQKIRDFFKGLARDGNVQVLVPDPPPGGTVHARLTPDGAIMCQTVEGGEREIELCAGDGHIDEVAPDGARTCQTVAKKLQKKADDLKDQTVITTLLNAETKGLSRDEAKAKLNNIVDEILGE